MNSASSQSLVILAFTKAIKGHKDKSIPATTLRTENSGRQLDAEQRAQAVLGSAISDCETLGHSFTPVSLLSHLQEVTIVLPPKAVVSIGWEM